MMAQDIDDASSFEEVVESSERTLDEFSSASVVVSDSEETEVRPGFKAIPKETFENLKKDETFFFSFVTFRVGDRLFRVPRDAFENQSQYFRDLFAQQVVDAPTGSDSLENDIMVPIFLPDVDVDAFRDFLRLLFPPSRTLSFTGPVVLTSGQWIKVLELAHAWQFNGICALAVQELESESRSTTSSGLGEAEKLELALKYDIKQWYLDAYLALAKRPNPLTAEEGERLGLDRSLKISAVRERRLARMLLWTQVSNANAGSPSVTNEKIDSCCPRVATLRDDGFRFPPLPTTFTSVSPDTPKHNNPSVPSPVPSPRRTGEQHPRMAATTTTITSPLFGIPMMYGMPRSPSMSTSPIANGVSIETTSPNAVGASSSAGVATHAGPTRNRTSRLMRTNADCEDVLLKKDINETFGL